MLSKPHRLKTSKEFDTVYKHSRKSDTPYFRVFVRDHVKTDPEKGILALPRFGIVASKKVGNAPTRNLAKRRMREIIRHYLPNLEQNFEAVVVLFNSAADAEYSQLEAAFTKVLAHKIKGTPAKSSQSPD